MASKISEEESQQLLRTIEMFEAITESQREDFQSLEILKEAYLKLGRQADSLRVSKKLADAYVNLGHISQAILEYEGILQELPDDTNARAALAELEARTSKLGAQHSTGAPSSDADSKPRPPAGAPAEVPPLSTARANNEDGDQALANALVAEKLTTMKAVQPLLDRLETGRATAAAKGQSLTLVQMLVEEQNVKIEDILTAIVDKSGLPYMPLYIYDVDRDIAALLPQELCFQACIVPFDLISRSMLIATSNPFDAETRKHVENTLDYSVFWYVAAPQEITTALRKVYGLDSESTAKGLPQVSQ